MAEKAEPFCPEGGELLACGATDYYSIGRTKDVRSDVYPSLQMPHRFKSMQVRGWGVGLAFRPHAVRHAASAPH